jgi:hypothetical protein
MENSLKSDIRLLILKTYDTIQDYQNKPYRGERALRQMQNFYVRIQDEASDHDGEIYL